MWVVGVSKAVRRAHKGAKKEDAEQKEEEEEDDDDAEEDAEEEEEEWPCKLTFKPLQNLIL